jgi:hypothetical protein
MQQPLHIQLPHTYSQDGNKELKRRTERKIEDVLGKGQFGLRRGKGTGGCNSDVKSNINMNYGHR